MAFLKESERSEIVRTDRYFDGISELDSVIVVEILRGAQDDSYGAAGVEDAPVLAYDVFEGYDLSSHGED